MSKKKDIRIDNPLNYGIIWYPEYFEDTKQKEGLKKYNFKKKNKAKNYHRWECKFWNNTCELTIYDRGLFFDSYGLDETGEFMRHTLTFNVGVYFDYNEIKWFVETMQQINDMINNKKSESKITLEKDYKFVKQY